MAQKAGASSAAEIIARAERAEREQERMMHTFIDAANVAEPAGGSRRRSRQEMLARRSGSTRSATRKPSQLTAMLEAAQRRDAETQRLAAEERQRPPQRWACNAMMTRRGAGGSRLCDFLQAPPQRFCRRGRR